MSRACSASETSSPAGQLGTELDPTPLWYILKEASCARTAAVHLGPTGGQIVAEVFAGLLELDRHTYLNVDPRWQLKAPAAPAEGQVRSRRPNLIACALS